MPQYPDDDHDFRTPPWRRRRARRVQGFFILSLLIGAAGSVIILDYYRRLAENEDITRVGTMPERSVVFDRNGREIGRLHGMNRTLVPLTDVSPLFIDALLAREDSRFFRHGGVDWKGVGRAGLRNIRDRQMTQGASTLTMQLARVSFDIREKTLHRKLLEAMLALRIEKEYQKNEILQHYVNRIYFGSGLYGVERAAQAYFGKPAKKLDLSESAMLAGIIRGPNRFSPFRHYEAALLERDTVINRMLFHNFVTREEAQATVNSHVTVRDQEDSRVQQNSYALDVVRRDLELILEKRETEDGGLRIHTTYDAGIQAEAEASVERRLALLEQQPGYSHPTRSGFQALQRSSSNNDKAPAPNYVQGSAIVLDNASGGIRALVGGRDFQESQFNRATMGRRQIGSLFKALVYAEAYRHGLLPGTTVDDGPIAPGEIAWTPGRNWSPNNSDGTHRGPQEAEYGLIKSRNTMSVRVGEIAGIANVEKMATTAGLTLPEERSPQLYIGNLETTLRDVTSAFSAIPNEGYRMRPYVIEAVQDARGHSIYKNTSLKVRMLSPGVAWLTAGSMKKVMEPGGTGASARQLGVEGDMGGKTGTTDAYKDAWFIGFTEELTCGVWVGLDQPRTIVEKGYGSTLALPIWADIVKKAQKSGYPPGPLRSAVPLTTVEVCRTSGRLVNFNCRRGQHGYRVTLPYELVPRGACETHGLFNGAQPRREPAKPEDSGFMGRIRGWFGVGPGSGETSP